MAPARDQCRGLPVAPEAARLKWRLPSRWRQLPEAEARQHSWEQD